MALLQDSWRFLIKKLFTGLKDSKDVFTKNTFSTTSLTLDKHYNPKFKWERSKKVIPMDIPDFHKKNTLEEWRSNLKKCGILPPRYWRERPMTITCTGTIMDPYKPPTGDGKTSFLGRKAQEILDYTKAKKDDRLAINKIRSYDTSFNAKTFPQYAHDIYVKAHTLIMKKDPEELSEFVTETAITEMMDGIKLRTLKWKFVESLEPPILIQARYDKLVSENNFFAQITVRFHTKQILAIYDRFGRLIYGHEEIPKDVLEYIVFEKHIVNEYGAWRLHGKIIPEWIVPVDSSIRTSRIEKTDDEEDDIDDFQQIREAEKEVQQLKEARNESKEVKIVEQ